MGLQDIDSFLASETAPSGPQPGGLAVIDAFLEAQPAAPVAQPTTWRQRLFKTGAETLADPNATAIERFLAGYTVGARQAATEGAAGDPRLPFAVRALPHAIQTLFMGPPSGVLTGLQTADVISPETAKELSNLAVSMTPAFMAPTRAPSRVGRVTEPLRAREAMLEKPAEVRPIPEPPYEPGAPSRGPIPQGPVPETPVAPRVVQEPAVAPAAPSAPAAGVSGIQAEIARLQAENAAMRQVLGTEHPITPEPVRKAVQPKAAPAAAARTSDVGLDSKLTGRQVTLGYDDAAILQEMEGRVRNVGGETATKAFREVGEEFRDRQGPEVVGFKTPKPEWMQDAKKPGEYYGYQETLNAIEALRSGKWPKTAKQQRIAEQLMDAVRFDAEQEKAAIRGAEKAVEAHDVSIAADVAREQQIQNAFFAEVDRLAAEETGVPSVVAQAAQPAEGARPVKAQPEMFTGREMIGPAVRQEKVGTSVPQAEIGDELLAGMRKPEPETQMPMPETVQPKPVTLGSLGGALQDAAGFLPESVRNLQAAYRRQVQKGIDYIVAKTPKVFREGRGLGNEYVDLVHDRSADLANYVERAVELGGKLQEGLTPAEKARVDQVLRGGITVNPAIQAVVAPARALINELQSKLVKYGYLTPEDVQLFQERFRENPAYLRRLYASKLVPPDQPILTGPSTGPVGRGVKSEALMMRGDIKDVQLPLMGGEPLVGRQRADFLQPYLQKGYRLIKVEGDTATLFRDIAQGKRQEMGEIRGQPGFVAARTIAEQARIVANHEFLEAISKNPAWAKVALTEEELASGTWTRLKGDKKKWGPLADYFVQKDVAKEVSNSIRLRQDWEKVVGRLVGMWKYGKVIMNPAAMGRNTISSAILADFGGLHPWMVDSYAAGAMDLVKGTGYVPEAKKLGLFRTGFAHNEITQLAEGIVRSEQSNAMLRVLDAVHDIAVATGEKTRVKPSKLYGAIENFYRYSLYRYGREELGLSPKDARRYSLKYAIDYEVVSPFVAALRGTGGGTFGPLAAVAGAPFATFACVDTETEVLTRRGWLRHDQCLAGDDALAFDDKLGELAWRPIVAMHRYPHDGPMVAVKNRHLDMLLTPNHRCVVYSRKGRLGIRSAAHLRRFNAVPTVAPYRNTVSESKYEDAFVQLVGWFVTEGWWVKRGDYQYARLSQSESNPRAVKNIRTILESLGGHYSEWRQATKTRFAPMRVFYLRRPISNRLLSICPKKQLTFAFVLSLPTRQLGLLVAAMLDGDGHRRKDGRFHFIQNAGETLESFRLACLLLGQATGLSPHGNGFGVASRKADRAWMRHGTLSLTEYRGVVWCPEVAEYGTWVARRNGQIFITGNSKAIPLTMETLALHPVRVLKYPAAIYGLTKLAESQISQAPEETRAQRLLGELSSIRYALLPFRDKDGRAQYLDLGYILPFGDLLEFGDMLMGETGRRANISLLPIVGHPAFTVAELALNRAGFTGKDIVAPSDDRVTAVRKRAEHLLQSWGPALTPRMPPLEKGGFAFEDIRKSFTGETDFLGRTRSPGAAALANIFGLRAKGVTTAELANYKATQIEKMFDDIDAQALQIATTYRNQPDEANRRIGELMQRARTIALEAKALFGAIPKEFSRPRPPEPVRKAIGGGT